MSNSSRAPQAIIAEALHVMAEEQDFLREKLTNFESKQMLVLHEIREMLSKKLRDDSLRDLDIQTFQKNVAAQITEIRQGLGRLSPAK